MKLFARIGTLLGTMLVLGGALGACKGTIGAEGSGAGAGSGAAGNPGSGAGTGSGGSGTTGAGAAYGTDGGAAGNGGGFTTPLSSFAALRKIKNVLTGLPPTDAEVAADTDPTALQTLINGWMALPQYQDKMMFFFSNAFQQSSLAVLNFEFQLRMRPGAFDLPYGIFGDTAFPMLFQNMQQSFARTCLQIISSGQPFTNILTTQQFMMTTALMSMYMQIEMPYDIHTFNWQFNHGTRPALADTLNPASPNYMIWGYAAPTTTTGKGPSGTTCAGDSTKISTYPGNTNLFHVLLGVVDRDSTNNGQGSTDLGCFEHAIQPYITPADTSDWRLVTITNTGTPIKSYDLPDLRAATTLPSKLPRVSFFTTPSFLAIWNTNDSNQHRVTANQALLGALNEGFTDATAAIPTPPSAIGLDGTHAVTGTVCYACHKSLDPMRQFWGNSYDYNDQVGAAISGNASFGFGNVTQNGTTLVDFGTFVGQVTDTQVAGQTVNRFAMAMTQKLCFFANSAECEETDPEMRRVALAFQNANYDFPTLVRQLFSSPLVSSAADTATFDQDGVTISITRRDQLCASLSNRLGKPDICQILMPTPTGVTTALNRLASSIDADAFSRGSQLPVTSSEPNLFYRAASELVCEAVAAQVVDATSGTVYSSTSYQTAISDMVVNIMGVPASDPHYAAVLSALQAHYAAAIAAKATATSALRSTFSAACQSPTSLALGI
ncbi:MAG TPA: hypothetical protein VFG23_02010 [Polyangia bacterium]|nr:hypothetical protein [Polyangia bacterium]